MLLRRARRIVRLRLEQLRSFGREVQTSIEVIRQFAEELRLQREQREQEALARKPFDNDLWEWDEHMLSIPGSYAQRMEWERRVRAWGRENGYRWDAERARFVREPTQEDAIEREAEGRSLTYSVDEDGDRVIDCTAEVVSAYLACHADDPTPEPGPWSSTS